jgi:hypothetical protein
MGQDFSQLSAKVPVEAEVHVADWLGVPLVSPVWTARTDTNSGTQNVYMQRWDNPRPDTPIESIVVRSRREKEVPIVLGITLANDAPNLIAGDFAKSQPFDLRMKHTNVTEKTGALPQGWSANAWHETTVSQVNLAKEPTTGEMAVGLANLDGRPSVQLYLWQGVPVQAGRSYTVSFKYLTGGGAESVFNFKPSGGLKVKSEIPTNTEVNLGNSADQWKQFAGNFTVEQALARLT